MEPIYTIILSLFYALSLCLIGEALRISLPGLRKILLPGAILGGALAIASGPQILDLFGPIEFSETVYKTLGKFPPLFINVVFAALMLGRPIHNFRRVWLRARPQIIMGHIYAWGQYVVGLGLVLALLVPVFGINPLAGPAIAIGFQGGHGTAAGLESTFRELGYAEGKTLAYALATFGIIGGTIFGPLIANLHRRGKSNKDDTGESPSSKKVSGGHGKPDKDEDGPEVEFSPLTGSLTVHLAVVGLVILAAYGLLQGASALEAWVRGNEENLFTGYIPLFSVVLIVGLVTQLLLQLLGLEGLLKRTTLKMISAFALDMVIVGALASLDLGVMGEHWLAILVLCVGGFFWNVSVFYGFGPRIYPDPWFTYGLGDLGGGTATTATGLLLIRIADPKGKSEARTAYTEKQPFYEPFMGGGLVTAFALPIVASWGAGITFAIVSSILVFWVCLAIWLIAR